MDRIINASENGRDAPEVSAVVFVFGNNKEKMTMTQSSTKNELERREPPLRPADHDDWSEPTSQLDSTMIDTALQEGGDEPFSLHKPPPHLVEAILTGREMKACRLELGRILRKLKQIAERAGGAWMSSKFPSIERHIMQAQALLKFYAYECVCPHCMFSTVRECNLCEGRGFLDQGHYAGSLNADEKKWASENKPVVKSR